jgi:hypothetical protein
MTKKLMKKSKLVAWLSVVGVLAVTAIALFAVARPAAHAATSGPNRIDMTSVTADEKGKARMDVTYTCQPGSGVVSLVPVIHDHDAKLDDRANINPTCNGKVQRLAIFLSPSERGKVFSLGDHVTAIAALVDNNNTAVDSTALDKEDVTL